MRPDVDEEGGPERACFFSSAAQEPLPHLCF